MLWDRSQNTEEPRGGGLEIRILVLLEITNKGDSGYRMVTTQNLTTQFLLFVQFTSLCFIYQDKLVYMYHVLYIKMYSSHLH